jgi:nucleotide-binding universal stress UspA family protein
MSPIRSLLVQLDATPAVAPRLRAALALAARHGAALTGAFGAEPPASPMATVVSDEPAEPLQRADRAAYEQARALFEDARAAAGVQMHWREPGPDGAIADLCDEAAYADLLVLGTPEAAWPEGPPAGLVDDVLRASGRPALVVPAAVLVNRPEVVLVGWDASAAAAHALAAAQPWLEDARRVLVLDGCRPGAEGRILAYLQARGIEAERVSWPHGAGSAGEALLALALRERVELLVMGHGHGRLRELLLGGATRSVLSHPPLPLLMAH